MEHVREKRTAVFLKPRQTQEADAYAVSGETEYAPAPSSRFRRATAAVMMLFVAPALAGDVRAEPGVSDPASSTAPAKAKSKPKAVPAVPAAPQPAQQPALPGVDGVLYLIRSTLLTLNDANRTGNYTVLRNFDLFAVAVTAPQLTASPALDANRLLRLTGLFPTRPLQINFDLVFEVVNGRWCLDGISVATPETPPQAEAAQQPANAPAPVTKKPAPKPP